MSSEIDLDFVQKRKTSKVSFKEPEKREDKIQPGFGFMQFFVLKILFWDLPVSILDTGSDFFQAYSLYFNNDLTTYGIIIFFINWLPGIVAAIHLISVKRRKYGAKKTLSWAGNDKIYIIMTTEFTHKTCAFLLHKNAVV